MMSQRCCSSRTRVLVVLCIIFVGFLSAPAIYLAATHHLSIGHVRNLGGWYLPAPGWPLGSSEVSLGTKYIGEIEEVILVDAIRSQRFNISLHHLGLSGHHITASVASAVIETKTREIAINNCVVDRCAMYVLLQSPRLRMIYCDDEVGDAFERIMSKSNANDIKIFSPSRRKQSNALVPTAPTTCRA